MLFLSRCMTLVVVTCTGLLSLNVVRADTWPMWRGPDMTNHAAEGVEIPVQWDLATGRAIAWQTPIPGSGHSSPTVTENAVYLTTAVDENQTQSLLKFDRQSGQLVGELTLHRGTLPKRIHPNNTHASPTPAFDGENLFVSFHTDDSIVLSKVSEDMRLIWQKKVNSFQPRSYKFGYGASPIIEGDLVLVAAEYDGEQSGIYALSRDSGDLAWKFPRSGLNLNFASPSVGTVQGKRMVLIPGELKIVAIDPPTGKQLWATSATSQAICNTIVVDGDHAFVSGGYPDSGTWAIAADGSGKLLWQNNVKCYEQSLLVHRDHVYGIADTGVAYCWRASDGRQMWKRRVFGGGVSASPVLVGERIYAANEDGQFVVYRASPDRFESLATFKCGDSVFATPVAVDDVLYVRTAELIANRRQEYLIAVE